MIGKLQGLVDYQAEDFIILMAGGVGYKVFVPRQPAAGTREPISLWIETIVREDSIRLFGFESLAQHDLFNKLNCVGGVGPKAAIAILGAFKPETLMTAIAAGDAKTLTAAPGVGKRVAEKIIVELKGKIGMKSGDFGAGPASSAPLADLLSALESLGYKRADVVELAQKLARENPDANAGALVRMALKEIAK
jgi:Holliday junction DNA helicase RuvA